MKIRLSCQSCRHDVERPPSDVRVECGVFRDNVVYTCPRASCATVNFRLISPPELLVLAAAGVVVPDERLARAARTVLSADHVEDDEVGAMSAQLDGVDTVADLLEIWDQ